MGNIRPQHVEKNVIQANDHIIVLGGPAMLIGLGGGAASSMSAGQSDEDLDFASVQRDNPEMERRCQEVINTCWALNEANPIISIHDVGAGGLSNAVPEILHDSNRGGVIQLRAIPNADLAMSPLEIWCNEATGALRYRHRSAGHRTLCQNLPARALPLCRYRHRNGATTPHRRRYLNKRKRHRSTDGRHLW